MVKNRILYVAINLIIVRAHYFDFYPNLIISKIGDDRLYFSYEMHNAANTDYWYLDEKVLICFSLEEDFLNSCVNSSSSNTSVVWITKNNNVVQTHGYRASTCN